MPLPTDLLGKPLIFSNSFVDPTMFVSRMALPKSACPMVMSVSLFFSHLGISLARVSQHCVLMANTLGVRSTLALKGKKTQRGCEASSILGRDSEMRPENPNTAER